MATSAEKDDKDDDKNDDAEGDAEEAEAKAPAAKTSSGDKDDADDEDDDEEEKPAPKPAPAKSAAKTAGKPGAKPGATKRAAPLRPKSATPAPRGSFGKSLILFVIVFGGLAAAFAFLGREENGGAPAKPKWTKGQTVDVELTVVKNDQKDLSCASSEDVEGRHCAFEAQNKPWSKGDNSDDKKLLKPYTTTDRIQFTAAGLWTDPGMAPATLPATRFSVKCKYKVEGTLKKVEVRWDPTGQWYANGDWYAGSLSECKVVP